MLPNYRIRKLGACALCVIMLSITACLDAPRDNIWDPDNPDKAYFSLIVRELGYYEMPGAVVDLLRDGVIIKSDTSDENGVVAFADIDPGIYDFRGEATYYAAVDLGPESLCAGAYVVDQPLDLCTLPFEDEVLGMGSAHGLVPMSGTWSIAQDDRCPDAHSTPQVYQGMDHDTGGSALSYCETEAQYFVFEVKLSVDTSTMGDWEAGVVFRYQDESNYCKLVITPDTVTCYCLINGQKTELRAMARESVAGAWYTIRVERRQYEAFFRTAIDNSVFFGIYDTVFSGGLLGLTASNYDNGGTAAVNFDDVTLCLGSNPR
ncbi:hypothetical protein IBX73_07345 [candidate division WOR-3 bacterium]|nr:hypothetical protein [candidate division WOR-3 bacterium]